MGEWLPTPPNGHPSGRLPDEFLAENPRAQYDHTVSDWERKFSDPNVVKLRSQLEAQSGIPDLELVEPHQIDRAVELFERDGFVAVKGALTPEQVSLIKAATDAVVEQILESDPQALSGSGPGRSGKLPLRYSFGGTSGSGHHLHNPAWRMLVDLPTTTPILKAIFRSDDYFCGGAGGDCCLPGAIECQRLHADLLPMPDSHDHEIAPVLTINFAVTDLTRTNGSIRQIRKRIQWTLEPASKPEPTAAIHLISIWNMALQLASYCPRVMTCVVMSSHVGTQLERTALQT